MVEGLCRLASSCPISPPTSLPFDSILPFSFKFFFFFFFLMVKKRKEVYKEDIRAGMQGYNLPYKG